MKLSQLQSKLDSVSNHVGAPLSLETWGRKYRVCGETSGDHPFGHGWKSAQQLWDLLDFAESALIARLAVENRKSAAKA